VILGEIGKRTTLSEDAVTALIHGSKLRNNLHERYAVQIICSSVESLGKSVRNMTEKDVKRAVDAMGAAIYDPRRKVVDSAEKALGEAAVVVKDAFAVLVEATRDKHR